MAEGNLSQSRRYSVPDKYKPEHERKLREAQASADRACGRQ
jgi:hypothetical protein